MKTKKSNSVVMWIFFAMALGIIVYDAWASRDRKKRQTLSELITLASMRYTIVPFLAGVFAGHFWYSQKNVWKRVNL